MILLQCAESHAPTPMGLDRINLILRVEREFHVTLPDAVASEIVTLGQLHDAILAARRTQVGDVDPQLTWEHLATLVADELGVRRHEVVPQLRLYEDLNCGWRVEE